jgi:NTF2-like protein (DUF6841)
VAADSQGAFDRVQAEREVMSVLDAFLAAFNRQDAQAEAGTYHFPHFRLANDKMSAWNGPGAETDAWMNSTYGALRESGWDHSSWTRRRIVHMSDSKAHVDIEFTRHRKDGAAIASIEALYTVTKEAGRWGIKMRSSFDRVIAAPATGELRGNQRQPVDGHRRLFAHPARFVHHHAISTTLSDPQR